MDERVQERRLQVASDRAIESSRGAILSLAESMMAVGQGIREAEAVDLPELIQQGEAVCEATTRAFEALRAVLNAADHMRRPRG